MALRGLRIVVHPQEGGSPRWPPLPGAPVSKFSIDHLAVDGEGELHFSVNGRKARTVTLPTRITPSMIQKIAVEAHGKTTAAAAAKAAGTVNVSIQISSSQPATRTKAVAAKRAKAAGA